MDTECESKFFAFKPLRDNCRLANSHTFCAKAKHDSAREHQPVVISDPSKHENDLADRVDCREQK
jgi:hypothetical protein